MEDTQDNKTRYTSVGMTIETYGTDPQRAASIQRLKDELELQGFNITFFMVFRDRDDLEAAYE